MRLSALQKMLWGLTAIAIAGLVWLQASTISEKRAGDPAFRADFELTGHQSRWREAYDVFLINDDGSTEVFSSYSGN